MHSSFIPCNCASGRIILFPYDPDTEGIFTNFPPIDVYIRSWLLLLQGITTYEYVVAMRTLSEPPGPSVDGGEQQSLPSSPTSSAVTAMSGRSSVGMSLQYKGAWCTPPRIFMDHPVLPSLSNCLKWTIWPVISLKDASPIFEHYIQTIMVRDRKRELSGTSICKTQYAITL